MRSCIEIRSVSGSRFQVQGLRLELGTVTKEYFTKPQKTTEVRLRLD
jgi:hypothetical protein